MTATRRWCVVALGVAILVSLPIAINALPRNDSAVGADELLSLVQQSEDVAYHGLVESRGSLQLPVSDQFTDVADLFGGRATMRVWWRGHDDWRVDQLSTTGETGTYADSHGTTSWDFEADEVTRTPDADIRLPRASDLLPPELTHRLLEGARPAEVSRIAPERVAGVDALGLRLEPAELQSSISHVDLWADPRTGLPLRVAVYGSSEVNAALTATFLDVTIAPPTHAATAFSPPPTATRSFEEFLDIAAASHYYAGVRPPQTLAGLARRSTTRGAVGVYGRGATLMVALPLWDRAAEPLREQLMVTPGARDTLLGMTLGVDPLNLLLTRTAFVDHSWFFVGTVTPATLERAARQIFAHPPPAANWVAASGTP